MARNLRIDIEGDSSSGRRALDSLAGEADKAAKQLRQMEERADRASIKARKLAEAEERAADKTRDLVVKMQALEKEIADTGDETGDLTRKLEKMQGAVKASALATDDYRRAASRAAGEARIQARAYDNVADQAREAARAVAAFDAASSGRLRGGMGIDARLAATRTEIGRLKQAFANTGDDKFLGSLEKHYAEYDKLDRIRKRIMKDVEDDGGGKGGGLLGLLRDLPGLGGIFKALGGAGGFAIEEGGALGSAGARAGAGAASSAVEGSASVPLAGPAVISLGAAAALPTAAFLGSALGGGILAGAGAGAAGLGLAGAFASDPGKYGAKWDQVTDHIKKRWLDSSKAFDNELNDGLKLADTTLRNLPVEKLLAVSQSFVGPLTQGLAGGAGAAVQGLADALADAQPIVDKLGPALSGLGHDAGDFFRAISMGSKGGADGLSDFVHAAGYAVKATGVLILEMETLYESFRNAAKGAYEFATEMPGTGPVLKRFLGDAFKIADSTQTFGHTLDGATTSSHKFGSSLVGAAKDAAAAELAALGLNDALTQTRDTMLGMADANVAVAQGWLNLKDELRDGAKTLDLNKQAGIDNQKVILDQVQLLEQQRQNTIKLGGSTETAIAQANAAFQAGIDKIKQMAHEAGFSDQKVDELIRSLGLVPPQTTANVNVTGLSTALGQGISLGNALNNIDGRTYVAHVDVKYQEYNPGISLGNLLHHARGGQMPYSGWHVVGEHGPEVRWDSRGTYTSSTEETRKLMSMVGSGSGASGGSSPATLVVGAGSDTLLGQLLQTAFSRGLVQVFDSNGKPISTRRG